MSSVRIRGLWRLTILEQSLEKTHVFAANQAVLLVRTADRSRLSGVVEIGSEKVEVKGRVRPGNPGIVSLAETDKAGDPLPDGLEAIIYIPPFWPTIPYAFDMIVGTLLISDGSAIKSAELLNKPLSILGVKPLPVLDLSGNDDSGNSERSR
jgi:hypothetical protein